VTAIDWWKGDGGDSYTQRNRVDWVKRIPFWKAIVDDLTPWSVLEVGCNAGWNLRAIKTADPSIISVGIEPNATARAEAELHGLNVYPDWEQVPLHPELVFTAGVLIHVPPRERLSVMQRIIDTSTQYVICIEYEADEETEIEYRGEMGLLWKRPYGKLYEEMGLNVLGGAFLPPESGFDSCTYWLLEK
jgi:hypothetical protein